MKTQLKRLLDTGFFHIFGSNVINKIIAFLSNIILVRILSKTDFGTYAYAYNIVSLMLIVSGMGIPSGLLQICSENIENKDKQKKIYAYGNGVAIGFNVLLFVSIIACSLWIPLSIPESKWLLLSMCGIPLVEIAYTLQTTYMRATLMTKEFAYSNNVNSIALCICTVLGAWLCSSYGVVFGRYLAFGITITFMIVKYHVTIPIKKDTIKAEEKKDVLKISIISAANNGISQLLYLLDVFLIGVIVADETVVASYKTATVIPTALSFIPLAVITYVYPYFAKNRENKGWVRSNYKKLVLGMGGLNVLISGMLVILAPYVIRICFGAKYMDCVLIFRILSVNYAICSKECKNCS